MRILTPCFVGRSREVDALLRTFEGAPTGSGGTVFLVGEAGVGRTRLAREAAQLAHDKGLLVLRGRGSSLRPAVPFRPIREALLSLSRDVHPDAGELGPYRAVLGRLVPEWHDGDQAVDPPAVVVLAEAVLRLLAGRGRSRGCLLVIDDLHEADAETLAVVEYLADNVEHLPLVLLATVRTEPGEALDLAHDLGRRGAAQVLPLDPLTADDLERLVCSALDAAPGDVPGQVVEQLATDSAGNPFVAEELLRAMVENGHLVAEGGRWRLVRGHRAAVPHTLVRSVVQRADRLGPDAVRLLSSAAVLGTWFPLSVLQAVTGMDDRSLLGHVQAAAGAHLVRPDERGPDWYAFRHPMTAEALLTHTTPADRAATASAAADAVLARHPAPTGEWCRLAAALLERADRPAQAAELFLAEGRRVLADGAASSAVTLLQRAEQLLSAHAADPGDRAAAVEALLVALVEVGRLDDALDLVARHDVVTLRDAATRTAMHVRLAWVLHHRGRHDDALARAAQARDLLGPDAGPADLAGVDSVTAAVLVEHRTAGDLAEADRLARQAALAAEDAGLPQVACQAWQTAGTIARERDLGESTEIFERARRLAADHGMPLLALYAQIGAAGDRWFADGDVGPLRRVRDDAAAAGAVVLAMVVDGILGLDEVLRGQDGDASRRADVVLVDARRLGLRSIEQYGLMVRAVRAAHRADRPAMEAELAAFRAAGGDVSRELPLTLGLGQAVCALLEEDRPAAVAEMNRVADLHARSATTFLLTGHHGLGVLLAVLDGRADWSALERAEGTSAGRVRWNAQFLALARAVLLGRDGRGDEAVQAVGRAADLGAGYPTARHLGLRLAADAARADGWGAPADWYRDVEEHFHTRGVTAVAGACRAALRDLGQTVRQRRDGTDRVPGDLRRAGITLREFEVFELLVHRPTNKDLAARLHISPRTVEKHMAALMLKTGHEDRSALAAYATCYLGSGPAGSGG